MYICVAWYLPLCELGDELTSYNHLVRVSVRQVNGVRSTSRCMEQLCVVELESTEC